MTENEREELLIRIDERVYSGFKENVQDHLEVKSHLSRLNGQVAKNTDFRNKQEGINLGLLSKAKRGGKYGGLATIGAYIIYSLGVMSGLFPAPVSLP